MQGSVIVNTLLSGAVSDAEIVIEAVSEDLEVKNLLFRGQTISWYATAIHQYMYQLLTIIFCAPRHCISVLQGDHTMHQHTLTAAVRCVLRHTPP